MLTDNLYELDYYLFLLNQISIKAKPPYILIKKKGNINTKKNKFMLPLNINLIVTATKNIQGAKHNNFLTGLGNADNTSRITVENITGTIITRNIVITSWNPFNKIKNIISYLLFIIRKS